jgi:hypothetical protein
VRKGGYEHNVQFACKDVFPRRIIFSREQYSRHKILSKNDEVQFVEYGTINFFIQGINQLKTASLFSVLVQRSASYHLEDTQDLPQTRPLSKPIQPNWVEKKGEEIPHQASPHTANFLSPIRRRKEAAHFILSLSP